jgi:anaerobic magnesium-protoporphyrin IX monomethyl ester cyclase
VRVLLINPTQGEAIESEAGSLPAAGSGPYPPLGLLYLQASLEAAGHGTEIVDGNIPGELERGLARVAGGERPGLVGVTALTPNLAGVVATVAAARRALPGARVALGGPHVDLFPREAVRLEGVDFALAGEGEPTLPLLAAALEAGRAPDPAEIPGLISRERELEGAGEGDAAAAGLAPRDDGASASALSERPVVRELDSIAIPERGRLEVTRYRGVGGDDRVYATMVTSRGCPYRCTFCSTPGGYRFRDPEGIVEEMERCGRLGVGHVYFLDDTFPTQGRRLHALCEAMMRRKLPPWSCRTAAFGLTAENLRLMRRAGCGRLQIGVETGTAEGLRVVGKRATLGQIERAFEAARSAGISTMAYFMLGLPNERTADDVRKMIRFAKRLGPTYAMFNVLTLYPGTALFRDAAARGLVRKEIWHEFALRPTKEFVAPIWDEHLSRDTLVALQSTAYRSFYMRPMAVLRLLREGGGILPKVKAGLGLLGIHLPSR